MRFQADTSRDGAWHQWFAWHPVVTTDGHLVWLESVGRRWDEKAHFSIIDTCDGGDYHGGWVYSIGGVEL